MYMCMYMYVRDRHVSVYVYMNVHASNPLFGPDPTAPILDRNQKLEATNFLVEIYYNQDHFWPLFGPRPIGAVLGPHLVTQTDKIDETSQHFMLSTHKPPETSPTP